MATDVVKQVMDCMKGKRFDLTKEKRTQEQVHALLSHLGFTREHYLDKESIIDLFHQSGVGIEIKIKGHKMDIFKQCKRYCGFEEIKHLILVTSKAVIIPQLINNKRCYQINIGNAWL